MIHSRLFKFARIWQLVINTLGTKGLSNVTGFIRQLENLEFPDFSDFFQGLGFLEKPGFFFIGFG